MKSHPITPISHQFQTSIFKNMHQFFFYRPKLSISWCLKLTATEFIFIIENKYDLYDFRYKIY